MSEQLLENTSGPKLKKFCIAAVFSIAFAYIEAAVVVYLREIFYKEGFIFPLAVFPADDLFKRFLVLEIGREVATIVLILTASLLFVKRTSHRIAYFLAIFALWDIFFYIWLKIFLNWPASILEWDILFLIPSVWASPVLAPIIVSLIMLIFAIFLYFRRDDKPIKVFVIDWTLFAISGLIIIFTFCKAGMHINQQDFEIFFSWPLFSFGCLLSAAAFVKIFIRS